jgi:hypothetical protein
MRRADRPRRPPQGRRAFLASIQPILRPWRAKQVREQQANERYKPQQRNQSRQPGLPAPTPHFVRVNDEPPDRTETSVIRQFRARDRLKGRLPVKVPTTAGRLVLRRSLATSAPLDFGARQSGHPRAPRPEFAPRRRRQSKFTWPEQDDDHGVQVLGFSVKAFP